MTSQALNEVPIYKGFLYSISDSTGEKKGHLAGSFHDVVDAKYALHPSMEETCQKATSVIVEVNFLEDPETSSRVYWKHPNEGIDFKILRMALLNNKEVHQLETLESQKKMLDTEVFPSEREKNMGEIIMRLLTLEDHEIQELDLPESDRIDLLSVKDRMKKINEGYKAGEKSIVKPLVITNEETSQKTMFWNRNLEMATKIDEFLKQQGSRFILIGTGHLWGTKEDGKKGVVALLRDKGWKVVKYDEQKLEVST